MKSFPDERQYWVWLRPGSVASTDDMKRTFAAYRKAGIQHVLPETYNSTEARFKSKTRPSGGDWLERALPIAEEEGIFIHAWTWMMPNNLKHIHEEHPDWFAVNRNGQSTLTHPAYVDYYKFMCPLNPEVHEFLQELWNELGEFKALAGLHLDYIRYPDVILPEGLQPKYDIVQDQEFPEYDYCYCKLCRDKFKDQTGVDPLDIEDPATHEEWLEFRYAGVINVVNKVMRPVARKHDKYITAAVFPNWYNVRQRWFDWDIDGFLPMLYHEFYNGDLNWLKDQTAILREKLPAEKPLFAGLFVQSLTPEELPKAMEVVFESGAKGVSLFDAGGITDAHLAAMKSFIDG